MSIFENSWIISTRFLDDSREVIRKKVSEDPKIDSNPIIEQQFRKKLLNILENILLPYGSCGQNESKVLF